MNQDQAFKTVTVACLACDAEQEIRYRIAAAPPERFACVKCGKRSVTAPARTAATEERPDPAKPWALSRTDRALLTALRVTPQ